MNYGDYYQEGYHAAQHQHLIADDQYFWARANASTRLYFSPEERTKRVFEYGCGIGQGIAALTYASGWDMSKEARDACRRRGLKIFDRIEDVPRGVWDIVLCRHVLEHVINPQESLKIIREIISANGMLLLVLPKEKHYRCNFEPDLAHHLFTWNFRTANNLLSNAGFVPYLNKYNYMLGYRKLLAINRLLGSAAYDFATHIAGLIMRNGELVIRAHVRK